jgi:hypothetical protein
MLTCGPVVVQEFSRDGIFVDFGEPVVEPQDTHVAEEHGHRGFIGDANAAKDLHAAVGHLVELLGCRVDPLCQPSHTARTD